MSAVAITYTVTPSTKTGVVSGDTVGSKDSVTVTLSGAGSFAYGGLRLAVMSRGEVLASCVSFDASYIGTMNMNTNELAPYFANMTGRNTKDFTIMLWDVADQRSVMNGILTVMNDPYSEDAEDPVDADLIGGGSSSDFTTVLRDKLNAIEALADVTDATNVDAAGAVMESDFDANTILAADADDTPAALTVAEQTLVGRITSGNITGLTAAQVRTLLNVEDGSTADQTGAQIKSLYEAEANTNAYTDAEKAKVGYLTVTGAVDLDAIDSRLSITAGERTKIGYLTVTGAVDLDTLSTTETFTAAEKAKVGYLTVTQAVNLDTIETQAAGAVQASTFNANTILKADSDDTPAALTVAEQTLVGRITSGVITGLSATQVRTLLNVANGAEANPSAATIKTQYESNANTNALTDADLAKLGFISISQAVNLDTIESQQSTNTSAIALNTSHRSDTANPHVVTKAQVGLTNVTDNAQMRSIGSNTNNKIPQWDGTSGHTLKDGLTLQTTISDSDTSVPSSGAVVNYVAALKLDDLATPDDNTDLDATIGRHGLLPKLSGVSGEYLDGELGVWTTLPSGGDVDGPATNTDGYIPKWNGADSKTLANGYELVTTVTDDDAKIPSAGAIVNYVAAIKLDNLATPDDNTDLNATSTYHGLLPKLSNVATDVLTGDGNWTAGKVLPSGAQGDLLFYDTAAWTALNVGTTQQVLMSDGTDPAWTTFRYEDDFVNGDLVAGVLTVTHNLGEQYVHVTIINNNNERINESDSTTFTNTTTLSVDLSSFGTITGTWRVIVSL